MPKQGHFAASRRVKQLNNFHQRHQHHESRAIDADQFADFLLVRFALTTKKRLPAATRESLQRYLQELAPRLQENSGDLRQTVEELFGTMRTRVPWQFFRQVSDQWEPLQHFLQREVPAVPLSERIPLKNPLTTAQFNQGLAQSLAEQAVAVTTLQTKLPAAMQRQLSQQTVASIIRDGAIDWEKVRTLLAPVKIDLESAPDEKTRQWLLELLKK